MHPPHVQLAHTSSILAIDPPRFPGTGILTPWVESRSLPHLFYQSLGEHTLYPLLSVLLYAAPSPIVWQDARSAHLASSRPLSPRNKRALKRSIKSTLTIGPLVALYQDFVEIAHQPIR